MILAIDQGTTGTTCLVFDEEGGVAGRAAREFEQHFPRPGWVEHDADEIWDVTRATARKALDSAGIDGRELSGIGITNQRETVVAWDRKTGKPLHRAIVWQDRRTALRCDELKEQGREERFREATGLVLDPYFSGTKIEWLIKEGHVDPRAAFAHLARAALEAMAYQTVDAVRAMEHASGVQLEELKADGGASENGWLMRFRRTCWEYRSWSRRSLRRRPSEPGTLPGWQPACGPSRTSDPCGARPRVTSRR